MNNEPYVVRPICGDDGSVYDDLATPIDWPARFRAAADVAGLDDGMSWLLGHLADTTAEATPDVVEAIGRALEGRDR